MGIVKELQLGLAIKAAGVNDLLFPQLTSWSLPTRQRLDVRKVGDGLSNSAAFSVVTSMGRAFSEPTIREYERIDGIDTLVDDSPTAQLLDEPNPYMESDLLWVYTVVAIATTGASYFHKVRNQIGDVIELWPLYPAFVTPHTPKDGSVFIDRWEYQIPGRTKVNIPAEDIIQLRWLIDRDDHRIGWSPLKQVLSEILQDDEAQLFTTALLSNLGVPGVILTPKDPSDPGPQGPARTAMLEDYKQKFGGTRRGEPLIIGGGGMNVEVVSFSPRQMDLTALRRVPEERISAAVGWPAILSGLGAGLTATSGRGESATIREHATESTLVPLWRLVAKQLTRQLLREVQEDQKRQLRFDLTEVRALSQDEDLTVKRLDTAIQGGWATVAEGRRTIGLPVLPEHDVFLRNISQEAIGEAEDATLDEDDGDGSADS